MSSPHWKNYLSNLFQQQYVLAATDLSVHSVYQTDSVRMFYRLFNTAGLSHETSHKSQNESTKVHKLAVQSEWDWCSGYGWLSSQRMWFNSRQRVQFFHSPFKRGLITAFHVFWSACEKLDALWVSNDWEPAIGLPHTYMTTKQERTTLKQLMQWQPQSKDD